MYQLNDNLTIDVYPLSHISDPSRNSLSNYMLTLMVVHFLQTRPSPILPAVRKLIDLSGMQDGRILVKTTCICIPVQNS